LDRVKKERRADLVEVERQVSPRYETAAILERLEDHKRSPLLYFKNVAGTSMPVVTNICGSLGRIALGLDVHLREIGVRYGEAVAHPISPVEVLEAPVQEVSWAHDQVDLSILPKLNYHQDDAVEPYLTAAICVARDPETAHVNLSFHRLMIASRNTTGILMEPGKHLHAIHQKYAQLGRDMPLAVFVGAPPAWSIGALYSGPLPEYEVIGGLLKAPLAVVECLTQKELFVPARAELVLEGTVSSSVMIDEGPFGEFTGYGTGRTKTPQFTVTALTHRRDPIFQDIVSGRLEHLLLPSPAIEYRTLADARSVAPGTKWVQLIAPLTALIGLEKHDEGEPRRIIEKLLRADIYAKHILVVDASLFGVELREVFVSMALNVQATEHVYVYADEQGTPLDPSCPNDRGRTAKMGIDATSRLVHSRPLTKNRIPEEILASVNIQEILKGRP
jgi:2,5-furandicarboxylate decarboxylase 1